MQYVKVILILCLLIRDGLLATADHSTSDGDRSLAYIDQEQVEFAARQICAKENKTIATCSAGQPEIDFLWTVLKSSCFCDDQCNDYGDCCIDKIKNTGQKNLPWTCRQIRGFITDLLLFYYVFQQCPPQWEDKTVRSLCEIESSVLQENGEYYHYLQDVPVVSSANGVVYRNIFCAVCNEDSVVMPMKYEIFCKPNKVSDDSIGPPDSPFTDTNVFETKKYLKNDNYIASKQHFQTEINGESTICRITMDAFIFEEFPREIETRMCKPVIDTCRKHVDLTEKCKAYTSYVYAHSDNNERGVVYKNFHCALCNDVPIDTLTCDDPYKTGRNRPKSEWLAIKVLFDFNFRGGMTEDGMPCLIGSGQLWDPMLNQCLSFKE